MSELVEKCNNEIQTDKIHKDYSKIKEYIILGYLEIINFMISMATLSLKAQVPALSYQLTQLN